MSLSVISPNHLLEPASQSTEHLCIAVSRIKPLIKILLMNKVDLGALFADTDIQLQDFSETDKKVRFEQYLQLVVNARRLLPNYAFALYLGEQSFLHHDGLLATRIMSSETVEQGMELLTRYQPLFSQVLTFDFDVNDQGGVLTLSPQHELGEALPYFMEYSCSVIYSLGRFFLGGIDLNGESIHASINLAHSEPESRAAFDAFFSISVRFGQPEYQVVVSKSLLSQPLVFSNKASARQSEQICQARVSKICADNTILDRVKFMIHRQIGSHLSLDQLAEELCISSRTLRRQLQAHNTCYKTLLEDERKRIALSHIKKPEMSIENVADKLGYSDVSSFSRAFKRWYGVSPKHYQ